MYFASPFFLNMIRFEIVSKMIFFLYLYKLRIMKNKLKFVFFSILTGFLNGLFGAGGGIIAVFFLSSLGFEQKKAQASAIAVILPLCVVSSVFYAFSKSADWNLSAKIIPFGLAGAALGALILKKTNNVLLRRIFAGFVVFAGLKMLV